MKSQLYEQRPIKLSDTPSALVPPVQAGEAADDVEIPAVLVVPVAVAAIVVGALGVPGVNVNTGIEVPCGGSAEVVQLPS